jgi:hypothetical protein
MCFLWGTDKSIEMSWVLKKKTGCWIMSKCLLIRHSWSFHFIQIKRIVKQLKINVKSLCLTNSAPRHGNVWDSGFIDTCFLLLDTLSLVVSGEIHVLAALPSGKSPLWIWGLVDSRAGLDGMEKVIFLTLPGLELRPLTRPAGRCNDYSTATHTLRNLKIYINRTNTNQSEKYLFYVLVGTRDEVHVQNSDH